LTIAELLLAYLRFAKGYYVKNGRPTSEYGCIRLAVRSLEDLYGKLAVAEFSPLKLKSLRQWFIDADLSRGIINHPISRIKRVFRWGVENELVPASGYHGLQAVRGLSKGRSAARETEPVKPAPDQHVDAVKSLVALYLFVAKVRVPRRARHNLSNGLSCFRAWHRIAKPSLVEDAQLPVLPREGNGRFTVHS